MSYYNNMSTNAYVNCVRECLKKDIFDSKSCMDLYKMKNPIIIENIEKIYMKVDMMKPIIKKCIDNNIDSSTCYFNSMEKITNNTATTEFFIMFDKFVKEKEKEKSK